MEWNERALEKKKSVISLKLYLSMEEDGLPATRRFLWNHSQNADMNDKKSFNINVLLFSSCVVSDGPISIISDKKKWDAGTLLRAKVSCRALLLWIHFMAHPAVAFNPFLLQHFSGGFIQQKESEDLFISQRKTLLSFMLTRAHLMESREKSYAEGKIDGNRNDSMSIDLTERREKQFWDESSDHAS